MPEKHYERPTRLASFSWGRSMNLTNIAPMNGQPHRLSDAITQPKHLDAANGAALPIPVEQITEMLDLRRQGNEWHGANPFDPNGATEDGFILFADGNALDRKTGTKYSRGEVQRLTRELSSSLVPLPVNGTQKAASSTGFDWKKATIYPYPDETGKLLYEVGRVDPPGEKKKIMQRRPDGRGGWLWKLDNVRRVLYRLPEVLEANTVFICEGEKAADALNDKLRAADLYGDQVATTNSQGAGYWQDEFVVALDGKAVIVLPDNDDQGAKHATQVCSSIRARGKARSLKRLDLPNLPPKGDAADFFSSGRTVKGLLHLADAAPEWKPEEKTSGFRFLSLSEVLSQEPPQWLVDGLLTEGGTSLLTAKHASFKSFFALDLALSVATGKKWHGRTVMNGTVIYIAAEGATGVQRRAQAWLDHYSIEEKAARLLVWNRPVALHEPDVYADLVHALSELEPALIVVDTLARCTVGLEENSSADMGRYADAVDALAKASGAHVLTVHHNNKGGEYRGSTALPAAVDTHISLERKGIAVTLKVEKQKDAEEGANLAFSLLEVGESIVFQFTGIEDLNQLKSGLTANEEKVHEALRPFGAEGATHSEWMKAAAADDVPESSFKRAKTRLRDEGKIVLAAGSTEGERGAKFAVRGAKVGTKSP